MHAPHFTDEYDRPFALPANAAEICLDIPLPPSVNRTRRIDHKGHQKFTAWKKQAGLHLIANGQYRIARKTHINQYELTITLDEDQCKCDPSNILKAAEDFLVSLEIIPDDSPKFARRIIIEWGEAPDGARLTIRSMHGRTA